MRRWWGTAAGIATAIVVAACGSGADPVAVQSHPAGDLIVQPSPGTATRCVREGLDRVRAAPAGDVHPMPADPWRPAAAFQVEGNQVWVKPYHAVTGYGIDRPDAWKTLMRLDLDTMEWTSVSTAALAPRNYGDGVVAGGIYYSWGDGDNYESSVTGPRGAFDPATETFTPFAKGSGVEDFHAGPIVVADDSFVIAGGWIDRGYPQSERVDDLLRYDLAAKSWSRDRGVLEGRRVIGATGRLIALADRDDVEVWDVLDGRVAKSTIRDEVPANPDWSGGIVSRSRLVAMTFEAVFDLALDTGVLRKHPIPFPCASRWRSLAWFGDRALLTGVHEDRKGRLVSEAAILDPADESWSVIEGLPAHHSIVPLDDERLLVAEAAAQPSGPEPEVVRFERSWIAEIEP